MSASVIIVTYNTGDVLRDCLAAIGRAEGVGDIVIVDNGNPSTATQFIDTFAAQSAKAQVLRGQGNVGFAAACNLGAARAHGDPLVFVNPDVVLNPDAISRMVAALAAAPPPAIVGGDLRDGDGRPERGSRRERLTSWRAFVSITRLSRFERWAPALRDFNRHGDPMPREATHVKCISGALFALRKADFDVLGGLDEGYFLHVDDVDLCRRAEQRGWPVVFLPGPHGIHRRSSSEINPRIVSMHKARSMAHYFQKFGCNPIERGVAGLVSAVLSLASRQS
ncbi:MAG: glycosyltransferase family 2 protein [Proteobacteria bacterium]|nr:glycosyltransferase family 2 protein [Pseudomonadota bacterium]